MHGRSTRRLLLVCAGIFTVASVATATIWSFGGTWPHPLFMYLSWIAMAISWIGHFLMIAAGVVSTSFYHALDRYFGSPGNPKHQAAAPSTSRGRGLRLIKGGLSAAAGATVGAATWVKDRPLTTAAAVVGIGVLFILPSGDPDSDWVASPPPRDETTAPTVEPSPPAPPTTAPEPSAAPTDPTSVAPEAVVAPTESVDAVAEADPVPEGARPPAQSNPPSTSSPTPTTPRDDAPEPTTPPAPPERPAPSQPPAPDEPRDRCLVKVRLDGVLRVCIG